MTPTPPLAPFGHIAVAARPSPGRSGPVRPAAGPEPGVLRFVSPLIGWPGAARFAVHELGSPAAPEPDPPPEPFCRLVSLDQPGLEFVAARPGQLYRDYVVTVPGAEAARLGLRRAEDVVVLALVSRRVAGPPTVNLLGPLVANRHDGRCLQLVLADSGYGPAVPADAGSSVPGPSGSGSVASAASSAADQPAADTFASRTADHSSLR